MTALPGALSSLMVKAVARAVRYMPDKPPDPLRHKHDQMGRPLPRVDGTPKVKGEALFAAEYRLDGLCYASLVYSTIAKGTISRIDTAAAEAAAGVIAVVTHENAPAMEDPPVPPAYSSGADIKGTAASDLPVLRGPRLVTLPGRGGQG